jgi:hypothetical protein
MAPPEFVVASLFHMLRRAEIRPNFCHTPVNLSTWQRVRNFGGDYWSWVVRLWSGSGT